MKVLNTISEIRSYRQSILSEGLSVGLVPTMGALHEGHLSLVKQAVENNEIVAVSIFVNPIQFNDPDDLKKYPRDQMKDLGLLKSILRARDIVFSPGEKEMYPKQESKKYDFGALEEVMEGPGRPGHFNGVGVVVEKLFRIIQPDRAYFGEKDFQQLAVIRKMTAIENLKIELIACPIIREPGGLAMSSRNQLLDPHLRKEAGIIYQAMLKTQELAKKHPIADTIKFACDIINSKKGLEVEYFTLADETTLNPVYDWEESNNLRCFVAVRADNIRLIDNLKLDIKS